MPKCGDLGTALEIKEKETIKQFLFRRLPEHATERRNVNSTSQKKGLADRRAEAGLKSRRAPRITHGLSANCSRIAPELLPNCPRIV